MLCRIAARELSQSLCALPSTLENPPKKRCFRRGDSQHRLVFSEFSQIQRVSGSPVIFLLWVPFNFRNVDWKLLSYDGVKCSTITQIISNFNQILIQFLKHLRIHQRSADVLANFKSSSSLNQHSLIICFRVNPQGTHPGEAQSYTSCSRGCLSIPN